MVAAFLIRWAFNVVALFVAAWLLSGITYGDQWWTLFIAAAVFTIVNRWVKTPWRSASRSAPTGAATPRRSSAPLRPPRRAAPPGSSMPPTCRRRTRR